MRDRLRLLPSLDNPLPSERLIWSPRLSCEFADVIAGRVPRSILQLIAIATLVICNLHSPSMLHAEDADHDHHAELVQSDHQELAAVDGDGDVDRGTVALDHHGPAAMTVAASRLEFSPPIASESYLPVKSPALAAWATAPPVEPPAA